MAKNTFTQYYNVDAYLTKEAKEYLEGCFQVISLFHINYLQETVIHITGSCGLTRHLSPISSL